MEKTIADSVGYFYLRGLIDELSGDVAAALEAYKQAHQIDPAHVGAMFRLAYHLDLHGDDEAAIELYEDCVTSSPLHANALLNLAVLYEDFGQYNKAIAALNSVLAANPNHARAKLFARDASASLTMYYDEDLAKRQARHNAVLDIPVTDFELSVRARNCLKKMNIANLGDLANISEAELLGYKNFGETSLGEIKQMLTSKGLFLGQALEQSDESPAGTSDISEPSAGEAAVGNEGVLATPLENMELSVRSRNALAALDIATIGELVALSETELMACKNFGQTSLNEIRNRLADFGLELRSSVGPDVS